MSPDGVDPQERVYGDTYKPKKQAPATPLTIKDELDESLAKFGQAYHDCIKDDTSYRHMPEYLEAKANFTVLIRQTCETVIGENEQVVTRDHVIQPFKTNQEWLEDNYKVERNKFRAQQRQTLKDLL